MTMCCWMAAGVQQYSRPSTLSVYTMLLAVKGTKNRQVHLQSLRSVHANMSSWMMQLVLQGRPAQWCVDTYVNISLMQ